MEEEIEALTATTLRRQASIFEENSYLNPLEINI